MWIIVILLSFLTCWYINIAVPGNSEALKTLLLLLFTEWYATSFKIYWSCCGLVIILWLIYICLISSIQSCDKKLLPEGMSAPCFLPAHRKWRQDWAVDCILLASLWTGNSPLATACTGLCKVHTFHVTDLHIEPKEWKAGQSLKDVILGTPLILDLLLERTKRKELGLCLSFTIPAPGACKTSFSHFLVEFLATPPPGDRRWSHSRQLCEHF